MVGRKKSYQIVIEASERLQLEQVVAARHSRQSEAMRARVVLTCAAHPDWSDQQVAQEVTCSAGMVRKWRKRWSQTKSLKELPRAGRPRVFSPRSPGSGDRLGL